MILLVTRLLYWTWTLKLLHQHSPKGRKYQEKIYYSRLEHPNSLIRHYDQITSWWLNILKHFNKVHLGVLDGIATTRQPLQPARTMYQAAGRTDTAFPFKTWQGNSVQPTLLYQSSLALCAWATHTSSPQTSVQETLDGRTIKRQRNDCPKVVHRFPNFPK